MPSELGKRTLWCAGFSGLVLSMALVACGSSTSTPTADTGADAGAGLGMTLRPSTVYSGFDGQHTFQAPIAVYDAPSDLAVSVDGDGATLTPMKLTDATQDTGTYYFLTTKKAGTFDVTATSGGQTTKASLVVTAYDVDRWSAGQTRYENGGSGNPPCTKCHEGAGAVDHSPAALAAVTDETIGITITTGIAPSGFPIQVDDPSGHAWTVTDTERNGLITYLRSLAPRGFTTR